MKRELLTGLFWALLIGGGLFLVGLTAPRCDTDSPHPRDVTGCGQ